MRHLCQPPRALERLQRRRTYYEAALCDPNGAPVAVISYDQKRTKLALLNALINYGPELAAVAGVDPNDCNVDWSGGAWRIGDSGFAVRWTGFTEYERASESHRLAA